jgi:acyl-CoA thioesterase FadM
MGKEKNFQEFGLAYGDCDAIGISYFAIYYRWMERTYSLWLHDCGLASHEFPEKLGIYVVGFSSECRYLNQAVVFDWLRCEVGLIHRGNSSYILGYQFTRSDVTIAFGKIKYACRDLEHRKVEIPSSLDDALASLPVFQDS